MRNGRITPQSISFARDDSCFGPDDSFGRDDGPYARVLRVRRLLMILGIVFMLLGIAAVVHPTYKYHQQEQVAKVGPFQATVDEEKTAQIPVAGTAALLVVGVVFVLVGARMNR